MQPRMELLRPTEVPVDFLAHLLRVPTSQLSYQAAGKAFAAIRVKFARQNLSTVQMARAGDSRRDCSALRCPLYESNEAIHMT